MKRLDEFFSNDEIEPNIRHPDPIDSNETVVVVSFSIEANFDQMF